MVYIYTVCDVTVINMKKQLTSLIIFGKQFSVIRFPCFLFAVHNKITRDRILKTKGTRNLCKVNDAITFAVGWRARQKSNQCLRKIEFRTQQHRLLYFKIHLLNYSKLVFLPF